MNTNILVEHEKQVTRMKYSSPILEEHGELHQLTHGSSGPILDPSEGNLAYPQPQ